MAAGDCPDDPAQRDLAWEGYHPRAAIPYFALAVLATALVQTIRWFVGDASEIAEGNRALALFAGAWAVWPALIAIFLYRTITYTYRLTDRALLADFGMLTRQVPAVLLIDVASVTVSSTWLYRRLGIGWVEVHTKSGKLVLPGVRRPGDFAEKIRLARKFRASTENGLGNG